MLRIFSVLFSLAITAVTLCFAAPAKAEITYPWCVLTHPYGGDGCGFVTREQCMMTRVGGTSCYENPAYVSPAHQPKRVRKSHRKKR
jgi:hypothetical protein